MSTFTAAQINDRARRIFKRDHKGVSLDCLPPDTQRAWRDDARLSLAAEERVWAEGGVFLSPGMQTGSTAKCPRCPHRVDLSGSHWVEVVVSEVLGPIAVYTHLACTRAERAR